MNSKSVLEEYNIATNLTPAQIKEQLLLYVEPNNTFYLFDNRNTDKLYHGVVSDFIFKITRCYSTPMRGIGGMPIIEGHIKKQIGGANVDIYLLSDAPFFMQKIGKVWLGIFTLIVVGFFSFILFSTGFQLQILLNIVPMMGLFAFAIWKGFNPTYNKDKDFITRVLQAKKQDS